jgi:hypothetical protein
VARRQRTLVSKVTAHAYAKRSIIDEMRSAGFTKFTITAGDDESWTSTLKK